MAAPRQRASVGSRMMAALAGLIGLLTLAAPVPAQAQMPYDARQVTVFGIIATPDSQVIDPKLEAIEPQLHKLLPHHRFKLLDVKTKRLQAGQAVRCNLSHGYTISTNLIQPLDEEGKVRLKCDLLLNEVVRFEMLVSTPPTSSSFAIGFSGRVRTCWSASAPGRVRFTSPV
jgi:hypothetical protein